jgi:hypothetical protein
MANPATYHSRRSTGRDTPEQPKHPAFIRPEAKKKAKREKRIRPPKPKSRFLERYTLTRIQVGRRVTSSEVLRRARPILQCETERWYCVELDGNRCGYYGDELEVRACMRRRCAECIEMKGK